MERKNIEEIIKLLEAKNYTKEEIDKLVELIKPFYDFYDFMQEKHNMNYDQVEEESSQYSEEVFPEYLEKMNEMESPLKYMLEMSGDIMKRYSIKYDYPEPEKVKIALTKYMELLFKTQIN